MTRQATYFFKDYFIDFLLFCLGIFDGPDFESSRRHGFRHHKLKNLGSRQRFDFLGIRAAVLAKVV